MLYIIILLVVFFNLFMGMFVLIQNPREKGNVLFALLSFFAAIWSFTNYMTNISSSIYWLESTYAMGSIVITSGYLWILNFTENRFKKKNIILAIMIALFFFVSSFIKNFMIQSYEQVSPGFLLIGKTGLGLKLFTIYYLTISILILYKLYNSQKLNISQERREQIKFVFWGTLITLSITALSSFVLPFFSIFIFAGIDNISFLIFLSIISFAISRHHLFNIKVITAELITFSLWIFMLVRTLLTTNIHDFIVEGGLFLLTIIFGVILIRSVLHEMKQRQKIEDLTQNLIKAYGQIDDLNVDIKQND